MSKEHAHQPLITTGTLLQKFSDYWPFGQHSETTDPQKPHESDSSCADTTSEAPQAKPPPANEIAPERR